MSNSKVPVVVRTLLQRTTQSQQYGPNDCIRFGQADPIHFRTSRTSRRLYEAMSNVSLSKQTVSEAYLYL